MRAAVVVIVAIVVALVLLGGCERDFDANTSERPAAVDQWCEAVRASDEGAC